MIFYLHPNRTNTTDLYSRGQKLIFCIIEYFSKIPTRQEKNFHRPYLLYLFASGRRLCIILLVITNTFLAGSCFLVSSSRMSLSFLYKGMMLFGVKEETTQIITISFFVFYPLKINVVYVSLIRRHVCFIFLTLPNAYCLALLISCRIFSETTCFLHRQKHGIFDKSFLCQGLFKTWHFMNKKEPKRTI